MIKPFAKGSKTGNTVSKCATRKRKVYLLYQIILLETLYPITSTHTTLISLLINLHSRLPPIVEDKVIESNNNNQATFFLDKLIMDFHRAHFAPITPTRQQYPSTPKLDHLQSIKDNDERPIRKPRKRKIKLSPTPGHDQ
ncbi:1917_t:CDS:2 [Rhizophagus irregularis]|nr:1917_t:CDS:2 [Rhizophagus irregularis]